MSLLLAAGGAPTPPSWIIGWQQPTSDFSPPYWIDRSGQSFDPFFSRSAVQSIPFFVRYPAERKWLDDAALPRQDPSFALFFVQRKHSPIFDPPRSTWSNWQIDEARRPEIEFPRQFFPQNGLSIQARIEPRRMEWESVLPKQEWLRFPFSTIVSANSPFFVYQSERRPWDWPTQDNRPEETRFPFVQNGLNLPLQTEKWHRIEAEGQPRQSDPWGDFRLFWIQPSGWSSAFSIEADSRIQAESFRRVSEDVWSDFRPFWIQPPQPVDIPVDQSTPGRIVRQDWWKAKPFQLPVTWKTKPLIPTGHSPEYYRVESSRINREISTLKAESARLEQEIARLEAETLADGVRRLAEQNALERELLLARQAAILVAVQEAMLIEEMEVIDIAFVCMVVVSQTQ